MKQNSAKKCNPIKEIELEVDIGGQIVSMYDIKKTNGYIVGKDILTNEEITLKDITEKDLNEFQDYILKNQSNKDAPTYEAIKKLYKFTEKGLLPPLGKNDVEELLFNINAGYYYKYTAIQDIYALGYDRNKKKN
jgi:hypothetical protein